MTNLINCERDSKIPLALAGRNRPPVRIMAHIKQFEHLKIPLEVIKSTTNNFSDESCIGKGGFGKVYKGEIVHSTGKTVVALKRLDRAFGQGDPEFWKEIIMLSSYKQENIVSLLGYCDDGGEKILVYEYAPNKSLDLYLESSELTWVTRLKICIGAACGLAGLHSAIGTQQRVLHRDIKSSNILLDENWNAKISDFGLSKFGPANQQITFLVSHPLGTLGYCDPLYAETGLLTKESDVYSFGVVLFEVLCGRLCFERNNPPLVKMVQKSFEQNTLKEIIFTKLKDGINPHSLKVYTRIAYQCFKRDREERPLMTTTVRALEAALQCQIEDKNICSNIFEERVFNLVKPMKQGILNVKVLRAVKLKTKNPYVELAFTKGQPQYKKTTVKHNNLNPKWYEEFNLVVQNLDVEALRISVYNWDKREEHHHDRVGMNVVPLKDLTPDESKILTIDLVRNGLQNEESRGQLMVEVVYKPFTDDRIPELEVEGWLMVTIEKGTLSRKHPTNLFVRLVFRGNERETKSVKNNQYPKWKSTFSFKLEKPPKNEILHLEVVTSSWMGLIYPEECLGYVDINLTDVVNNNLIEKTYDLIDSENCQLLVVLQWRTIT